MKPQALAKLDLLASAKEAALLEQLNRHNTALQRYTVQREALTSYQERLGSLWRGGAVVRAADAIRAGEFSSHAEEAVLQLTQALAAEQAKQAECASALAELRARRRHLQERLEGAMRLEKTIAEERAAQDLPHLVRNIHGKTETIA